MNSYEIEQKMKELQGMHWNAVNYELDEMQQAWAQQEDGLNKWRRELLRIAASNGSNWSGGFSVGNMFEQQRRELALRRLESLAHKESL